MKKSKLYLDLTLRDEIVEGRPEHSFFARSEKTALHDVLKVLDQAAHDRRISALVLTLQNPSLGWARLCSLRRGLAAFRGEGKPAYCFMERGGNAEYYLASGCSRVMMPPASDLHLVGLKIESYFLQEALERIGLQAQILSVGEYKSAGEMFTRTAMSTPAREQLDALLDDFYREFLSTVAQARGWSRTDIESKINSGPYTSREAQGQGLIDAVCYHDELPKLLEAQIGGPVRGVPAGKYFSRDGFVRRWLTFRRPRIAMIEIRGNIASGKSRRLPGGRRTAGSETICGFLEHARKARRIRAVVVRIDSPGGSGLASDSIWRKMSLLGQAKPVIASFGDVAASGGYYVAAPSSCIMAEPTTITGSIGVLGGKVVARRLMGNLSVHHEALRRGEHAGFDSFIEPFTREESERLLRQLEEFYHKDFVSKVSEGRKIDPEAVHEAGRGRIWSGRRAADKGLVDTLGGLPEAIREARRRAGIPDGKKIRLVHYARKRRLRDMLIPDLKIDAGAALFPEPVQEALEVLETIGQSGVLLWMPIQIRIR